MENAVIIGTYEFIGFALCKKLLNTGIEVKGIYLDSAETSRNKEDKNLEIGRNANFTEMQWENFIQMRDINYETTLIIPFFDFYMSYEDDCITTICDYTRKILNKKMSFIYIVPTNIMSNQNNNTDKKINDFINTTINYCRENNCNVKLIYISNINDPSQSPHTYFHNALNNKFQKGKKIDSRENSEDTININELLEIVVNTNN